MLHCLILFISKKRQITVTAKMGTNDESGIICLVNGFSKKKDPETYCQAVLYFEKENLASFSPLGVPPKTPKRHMMPEAKDWPTWEDKSWGTSVCKTIHTPLWAAPSLSTLIAHEN